MENTVVAVYDSYTQAQNAMNELLAHGFSRNEVQLSPDAENMAGRGTTADSGQTHESGIGHFFRSLFGLEEHREHRDIYSEAVRRGGVVLAVNADSDEERDNAADIMNRFDPVDIDERASHWRSQGWAGYDASAPTMTESEVQKERSMYAGANTGKAGADYASGNPSAQHFSSTEDLRGATAPGTGADDRSIGTEGRSVSAEGEQRIPVVEEELRVGKREVQRGGVRVYQRVEEKPVHESVDLRQEHVKVERHAVDEPASESDMAAFKEGSVELRETAEEPVVSKSARKVEEVVVGKDVSKEKADIDDTVRRTDVEVEQLGASGTGRNADYADTKATTDDSAFRTHWQNAYGTSGERYEDYDSAYRYGYAMGDSERFKNYRWEDAEPQIRSDWESRHPESSWDKVKDAVRYGAERVTGQHRH